MNEGGIDPTCEQSRSGRWGHDLEIVVAEIKLAARFKCKFNIDLFPTNWPRPHPSSCTEPEQEQESVADRSKMTVSSFFFSRFGGEYSSSRGAATTVEAGSGAVEVTISLWSSF